MANGAGLVAVLNFMFNKDSPRVGEDEVRLILQMYGMGALLALSLPVIRLVGILIAQEKVPDTPSPTVKGVMDVVLLIYAVASAAIFIIATMIVMWNATDVYAAKITANDPTISTARPPASAPLAPLVTTTPPFADPGLR